MKQPVIFVVDDEKEIRELLRMYLENAYYKVVTFEDGLSAKEAFLQHSCDLIIIDIMMPNMDGYTLCKEIRKISDIPIIIVSAKGEELDRVLGLELGADDYLSKPFSPRELMVRVKNILRRMHQIEKQEEEKDEMFFKDIVVSKTQRIVKKEDRVIDLTTKEFDLLTLFLENINTALSRKRITEEIWGYAYMDESRQVDDLVKRLRKKLLLRESECTIDTVWGYGYKIGE